MNGESDTQTGVFGLPSEMLRPIRSSELFSKCDPGRRNRYLDMMASAPPELVPPEAVYGTNGWKRRLFEFGVDPVYARAAFVDSMARKTFSERRDLIFGNALDRFYMSGVDSDIESRSVQSSAALASAVTGGRESSPEYGMAMSDPEVLSGAMASALFGNGLNMGVA